jgi:hypothetical protein
MGFTITKQEIDYPVLPTPQGYQAEGGQLGTLLSAMFPMGKKKSMTNKMQPIVGGQPEMKKKKR